MRWILLLAALLGTTPVLALQLLVLGDSISAAYGVDKQQGWVALMEARLTPQCPELVVNNASVSGETSAGGRIRLPGLLDSLSPDVVIIELGGNDGLRGLSPVELEANLTQMINDSRTSGADVILLGMLMPPNYGVAFVNMFREAFARVAANTGVPFMPFFLQGVAEKPTLMQDDGIHPTDEAQPLLLNNAWPLLEPLVEKHCET